MPAAVPEEAEVEPETVQHQDSGIRFRDGELPPVALPPQLPEPEKKYNVTREQVAEMRRLRAQDPERWSVLKLAERYDCRPLFVMMCCRASPEHKDRERARLDAIKARWGPFKTNAREERKKRKALLLKDAL